MGILQGCKICKSKAAFSLHLIAISAPIAVGLIPKYCAFSDNHKFATIAFPDGKVYKLEAAALLPQCQQAGPILAPAVSFTQLARGRNRRRNACHSR